MKYLILILIVFAIPSYATQPAPADLTRLYNMDAEFQVLYPTVRISNPSGSRAFYDGVGVRGNVNIPLYRSPLNIYTQLGGKYLDLKNTANSDAQYETANVIGVGGGLMLRYRALVFGARQMQMWSRHYSSGAFQGRTTYDIGGLEYFGGLYFRFDRLGVGLQYSSFNANISKDDTGLTKDAAYREAVIGLQFTFDMGDSFLGLLTKLF